jgi:hypothetical protein
MGVGRAPKSGKDLYMFVNGNVTASIGGVNNISDVPTPVAVTPITMLSWEISTDVGDMTTTTSYTGLLGANERLVVEATPPLSSGVSLLPKNKLRRLVSTNALTAAINAAIQGGYDVVFPSTVGNVTAGSRVGYRVSVVNSLTGQRTYVIEGLTEVVAA